MLPISHHNGMSYPFFWEDNNSEIHTEALNKLYDDALSNDEQDCPAFEADPDNDQEFTESRASDFGRALKNFRINENLICSNQNHFLNNGYIPDGYQSEVFLFDSSSEEETQETLTTTFPEHSTFRPLLFLGSSDSETHSNFEAPCLDQTDFSEIESDAEQEAPVTNTNLVDDHVEEEINDRKRTQRAESPIYSPGLPETDTLDYDHSDFSEITSEEEPAQNLPDDHLEFLNSLLEFSNSPIVHTPQVLNNAKRVCRGLEAAESSDEDILDNVLQALNSMGRSPASSSSNTPIQSIAARSGFPSNDINGAPKVRAHARALHGLSLILRNQLPPNVESLGIRECDIAILRQLAAEKRLAVIKFIENDRVHLNIDTFYDNIVHKYLNSNDLSAYHPQSRKTLKRSKFRYWSYTDLEILNPVRNLTERGDGSTTRSFSLPKRFLSHYMLPESYPQLQNKIGEVFAKSLNQLLAEHGFLLTDILGASRKHSVNKNGRSASAILARNLGL